MKTPKIYKDRLKQLRAEFKTKKITALLITKEIHIRYLTGFRGDDSWVFVTKSQIYILSDFRYEEELKKDYLWIKLAVRKKGEGVLDVVTRLTGKSQIKCLGFESKNVTHAVYQALNRVLKKVKLVPADSLIEKLRLIKHPSEIKSLKQAAKITDQVLVKMVRKASSKMTELDLKGFAESQIRALGGEGPAFDIIVATGEKTARPHAFSTKKRLKNGSGLLIDMGSCVNGYHSDLTRTFFVGSISAQFCQIYNAVLEAQAAAIAKIKPGVKVGEIDKVARETLEKYGLAEYFGHATGHGVGLEIHEAPTVFYTNKEIVKENMVFTVEPGVYIPGWGGVRIEDCVRVTKTGCELITNYPKNKLKVNLGR